MGKEKRKVSSLTGGAVRFMGLRKRTIIQGGLCGIQTMGPPRGSPHVPFPATPAERIDGALPCLVSARLRRLVRIPVRRGGAVRFMGLREAHNHSGGPGRERTMGPPRGAPHGSFPATPAERIGGALPCLVSARLRRLVRIPMFQAG
jgi:hypothetical protein